MYLEDEKTGLQKLIISLDASCSTIFRVSGKTLKFIIRMLAGEANQNGKSKEVNT